MYKEAFRFSDMDPDVSLHLKKTKEGFFFQICGGNDDAFGKSVEFCAHGGVSPATLSALKKLLTSEIKTQEEHIICNEGGDKISIFLERDGDIVFSTSQEVIFIANKELKKNQKQQLFQVFEAMKKDAKIS